MIPWIQQKYEHSNQVYKSTYQKLGMLKLDFFGEPVNVYVNQF